MDHDEMLRETYRLVQDNNRMLRGMRRSAFWGGLIRIVFYAALLLVPVWFYFTYMAPIVEQTLNTMNQIQGSGARAQTEFGNLQDLLKQLQAYMPSTQ